MDKQGLLLCARYCVAPNFYGYCGPDENLSLVDHLKDQIADKEVSHILSEFDTLYQYLTFIATENKISDPFNKRVVEAYWIGNPLLHNASDFDYISLLKEKLSLENKTGMQKFQTFRRKVLSNHFYPHHSFHVFNIFKRTGHDQSNHTLETMDACRIGWGKIVQSSKFKVQSLIVETKQLTIDNKQLTLSVESVSKELKAAYKGKSFLENLKIGDWVSFHWGFICDVLTLEQVKNLSFYTLKSIEFYNRS